MMPLAFAVAPPALEPGQLVGVCAPSGPCPPERLAPGLALLSVHVPLRLGPVANRLAQGGDRGTSPPYLAGSDEERADELRALIADPDIRAIVMARGGYGLTRILPLLDPAALRADPKPIVGFSDGTALLAWALHAGVRPLHGPVVVQLPSVALEDLQALLQALTNREPAGIIARGLTANTGYSGPISGRIMAANLSMLTALVGTPWQVPTDDALLALEEVGERPYAIDRDLTQLLHAEALPGLGAAILGDFTRCTDPPHVAGNDDQPEPAFATVVARLASWGIPAVRGLAIGHGARNQTLPCGARAELNFDDGTLTLLDAAVV